MRLVHSITLGTITLIVACYRDVPVAPDTASRPVQMAQSHEGGSALRVTIQELLDDPLFVAMAGSVRDAGVAAPLRDGLDGLARGDLALGWRRLTDAVAEVRRVSQEPDADRESLLAWSVVELYLSQLDPGWGTGDATRRSQLPSRNSP